MTQSASGFVDLMNPTPQTLTITGSPSTFSVLAGISSAPTLTALAAFRYAITSNNTPVPALSSSNLFPDGGNMLRYTDTEPADETTLVFNSSGIHQMFVWLD